MSKVKLYIDDLRDPPDNNYEGFIVLRSYEDAIKWIEENGCPDYISFDHDLGSFHHKTEYTGYDIVKWMVEMDMNNEGKWIPQDFSYTVHSANPIGAANIVGLLQGYLESRGKE